MTIIDPQLSRIRILNRPNVPDVMFQNLSESAIIGMNWSFLLDNGRIAFANTANHLSNFRLDPGKFGFARPHMLRVQDDPNKEFKKGVSKTGIAFSGDVSAELRELSEDEFRRLDETGIWPDRITERWNAQAAQIMEQYEMILARQGGHSTQRPPVEIRLSWILFEDGLFYGTRKQALSLLCWIICKQYTLSDGLG